MQKHFSILLLLLFIPTLIYSGQARSVVSRARADMRSVATGIEIYWLDHEVYPPAAENEYLGNYVTTPLSYLSSLPVDPFKAYSYSRFNWYSIYSLIILFVLNAIVFCIYFFVRKKYVDNKSRVDDWYGYFVILTIIVGVLLLFNLYDSHPNYTFPKEHTAYYTPTFNYGTDGNSTWILQSYGPDEDRDILDLNEFLKGKVYSKGYWNELKVFSYDSSNGTISSGDVFRIKD